MPVVKVYCALSKGLFLNKLLVVNNLLGMLDHDINGDLLNLLLFELLSYSLEKVVVILITGISFRTTFKLAVEIHSEWDIVNI